MPGSTLTRIAFVAAMAVAAGSIAFVELFGGLLLTVEDAARGRALYRETVTPGARFVVSYVHSSEHVPVRGTFRVEPDRSLSIVETAFAGFGPGLPALRPGDTWESRDGLFVQRDLAARLPELRLRVLPLTRHRVETPAGRHLDLSTLLGAAGGSVRISVRPTGLWERFHASVWSRNAPARDTPPPGGA